ncbi:Ydr279p protein family-domain-containing protein [Polychytrium aggregatum]|uniref:Ydr279p protein family-domain-containing protein n=1 Tax=Polychytrium aggregatum TaxID=110093 RepID=UPI0022FEFAC1|nr:Ydr279p protein family-domain-containing protein [Polychytrium aggregatum]KAI9199864.1 Ydr279p protein family-domain-containing protein [Polychytrium aggregatum]
MILVQPTSSSGSQEIQFFNYPHPKTDLPTTFAVQDGRIMELQTSGSGADKTSWFVDNRVEEDGSLLVLTPIDPAFLILPPLLRARLSESGHQKYWPLDEIAELSSPHLKELTSLYDIEPHVQQLCDIKESVGTAQGQFRLSDAKVLKWLGCKKSRLERLASRPGEPNPYASDEAAVVDLLCDYLPSELEELFRSQHPHLVSTPSQAPIYEGASGQPIAEPSSKKPKTAKAAKTRTVSAAQTTLHSFFKKG